jgi:thiamine pyrophosphate-dependent acetolactate synthase large subunit-like protein
VKAYELIADTVADHGVDAVFGLLGDGNMLFLAALVERHGVRLVNARHENAAVTMADGYARAGGRVGVCSVTCGPGLTQVTTALTAAVRSRTPLVLVAGDVPAGMAWNPQRTDQGLVTAASGARFAPVAALSMLAPTITEAFVVAQRDRVPVVVSIPYDLQELELEPPTGPGRPASVPAAPRPAPSAADVAAAADRLARAERPIVLAGRGAVESGAREAILELAARTGALLGTTLLARDWFRGEPFELGLVGGLSSRTARELIADCDVVLAVGAGLGYFATDNGALLDGKDVIQVDLDPAGVSEGVRAATSYVRGDAAAAVVAIERLLAARGHSAAGFRTPETAARLASPLPEYPELRPEPGTIDPAAVVAALDEALPPEPLLVLGVGHFWSFAAMGLHRAGPADHLYAYGFGAVGQGLATAIGAAVATGRPVVLVEGDGSLMMHLGELATVEVEALDLLVVVMNDGGYGSEIHKLNFKGADGELARFGRNDFAAIARGFGIPAHTVTDPAQVAGLVAEHLARGGPTVLDVPMAKDAISAPTRRALFPDTIPPKEA